MHGVDRIKTLEELLTDEGAVKAVEEFIAAGKVGHISISMYGSTRCIN
jgi:aryl-alcohol dehydrogenase-like predicted oxidoreductase